MANQVNELLFTREDIDAIAVNEKNVELYGLIITVNAPETVGKIKKYEVMKFLISNQNGIIIQCALWEGDILIHRSNITAGSIIHINGAWAVESEARFNRGSVPWELSIKSTTIIEVEETNMPIEPIREANKIKMEDVGNHVDEFIEVEGFLKSPFQIISGRPAYGNSSICTGYRVEELHRYERVDLRVSQFVMDDDFSVGVHLRVRGTTREERDRWGSMRIFIDVSSMADLHIASEEKKESRDMIKCRRLPKRQ